MPENLSPQPLSIEDLVKQMKDQNISVEELQNSVALFEGTRKMNMISNAMREENPNLTELKASEEKGDNHPLEKVEFPFEGVYTQMGGQKFPYKGFPFFEFVERIDVVKKIGRSCLSGFWHSFKNTNKFCLVFLIPVLFFSSHVLYAFTFTLFRFLERYRLKKERYCTTVREIHRAFTEAHIEKENEKMKEFRLMVRLVVCMILEFDNAYRYRIQDILPELNKENLTRNPIKELNRLMDIMVVRENTQSIKDSWFLIKKFVYWYLRFDRKLLKMIKNILLEINLKQVALDEMDKSYCIMRKDYTFPFMSKVEEPNKTK